MRGAVCDVSVIRVWGGRAAREAEDVCVGYKVGCRHAGRQGLVQSVLVGLRFSQAPGISLDRIADSLTRAGC